MRFTKLTNPFKHICCGCGLTHDVYIKICKDGSIAFNFKGNLKQTLKERMAGRYEFRDSEKYKKIIGVLRQIGTVRNDKEMEKVVRVIKNIQKPKN